MKKTGLESDWRKVRKLFKAYGFPYKLVHDEHVHCWTGEYCNIITPTHDYRCLSNAIHEFAHWLVSHPNRRNKPDFGLGTCPDSSNYWNSNHKKSVTDRFADKEELSASCLGIHIEMTLNLDPGWTLDYHSWRGWDDPQMTITKRNLRKRGLLDSDNKFPLEPAA